jgi:carbamoyltransferase
MSESEYLYILGVPNFANYEASAALLKIPKAGGVIQYVCIGEDRITRIKHTYLFPLLGIHYCLQAMGLEDLSQVDYLATDYARVPRWINSGQGYRKLEHDYLKINLDFPREKILVIDHHAAHAASAFYPSGFDEAAVLVVDGVGSRLNTQSLFHMTFDRTVEIERGNYWGIGRLYSMVTAGVLPYGPEKGYGKVMGLAAYGATQPGPVLNFGCVDEGMTTDYSAFFTRFPNSRLIAKGVQRCEDRQKVLSPYAARAAFDVQQECERQFVRMARYAYEKTGSKRLCISGGVALNGAANLRILNETPIEELWIQPGCSDTGIPFGLSLWGYFNLLKPDEAKRARVIMKHAYTGRAYRNEEIDDVLSRFGISHRPITPAEVGQIVSDGRVVAWFDGSSEFGPRALGHRSIVADPRQSHMKDYLNASVKFREGYRPYAPSIMAEHAAEWLELDVPSPFMLLLPRVRAEKRALVPAITHIDHTTRPQTVTEPEQGDYYRMIKAFYERTGVPMVLNTSFNINKEPIVETPLDALICALGTAVDYLYLQGRLVECAPYRTPELIARMTTLRKERAEEEWRIVTRKYLVTYDVADRDRFLEEENKIAAWYRDYRAKYEVEKAMQIWRERKSRILIAGTRQHTRCLYMYIPEFPNLSVVGFVPFDHLGGEQDSFGAYRELTLAEIPWNEVDAVLVSSHEHQDAVARAVRAVNARVPIVEIYDDACDSLALILPERWPILNPIEARAHDLRVRRTKHITAGNIDFDFQPSLPTIEDRYAVILTYHYCHPKTDDVFPGLKSITPEELDRQVEQLNREFQFVTVAQLLDADLKLPHSVAVLTFDDGLRDFQDHAMPVLARWKVPATIYCPSAPLMSRRLLDVHRIHLLHGRLGIAGFRARFDRLLATVPNDYELDSLEALGIENPYQYDDEETRKFKTQLNYELPYDVIAPILQKMVEETFGPEAAIVERLYLGIKDLKEVQAAGHDVGIHTHTHPILSRLNERDQRCELSTAAQFFRDSLGLRTIHVAYPYGRPGTWNHLTKKVMKDLGFIGGVTMARRVAKPQDLSARWEIPRFDVRDLFDKDNKLQTAAIETLFTG